MKLMLSVVALAAIAGSANAQVLFETDFENSTTYPIGTQLNSRPGWDATGNAGFVITDNIGAPGNSAVVVNTATWAANGTRWNWVNTPVDAATLALNPVVRAQTDVAIASGGGTRQTWAGLDVYGFAGATFGRIGAIRLRDDGGLDVLGGTTGAQVVSLPAASLPLNTFFRVGLEMNFATQKMSFLVDGVALDISAFPGLDTFDETEFSDADLYMVRAAQSTTVAGTGGDTAVFDNYRVEIVPAPGAVALAGLASLVGIRRRR